jgi:hypothetical protein
MSLPVRSASSVSSLQGFLLADIGAQPNGLPLTILTLFARDGRDPLAEAERLSGMPEEAAVSYMIAEIRRAPACYRTQMNIEELAKGIVARLPSREPTKSIDVSLAGNGFEGIPMLALMMMSFAIMTIALLAILLEKG